MIKPTFTILSLTLFACGGNNTTKDEPVDEIDCSGVVNPATYLNPAVTYGSYVDSRDSNSYATVRLGTLEWFAENLRFGSTCPLQHNLFTWYEATQGVCPEGWRLPSNADWKNLTDYVISYNDSLGMEDPYKYYAGRQIMSKTTGSILWDSNVDNLGNPLGFSAIPTGDLYGGAQVDSLVNTAFWSSDAGTSQYASNYSIGITSDYMLYMKSYVQDNLGETYTKNQPLPVRCVRDL